MEDVDRLLGFFENVLHSYDMGFALGSGLHYYLLLLAFGATGLTAAFAIVSLASSTLGKAIGARSNPGAIARQIVIAALLLAPMPYSPSPLPNQDALDSFAFNFTHEAHTGNEGGIGTGVYVSAAAHFMHKASMLFYQLIIQTVDEFLDSHGHDEDDLDSHGHDEDDLDSHEHTESRMGNANLWVFKVLNRSYSDDLKKGPALRNSFTIYRQLCEEAALRAPAPVRQEVWRRFGLFGGFFYDGATLIENPSAGGGNLVDINAAKSVLESVYITPQLNRLAPGGLMMHSKAHWESVFSDSVQPASNPWALRDTATINEHTVKFMPTTLYGGYIAQMDDATEITDDSFGYTTTAATIKRVKFFPKNCLNLYEFNHLAINEMREGARRAGATIETPLTPEANAMSATVISRLVQNVISKTTQIDHNELMGEVSNTGVSLFSWLETIKLQTTIPILLGTMALAYALLVALYPLIITFSVLQSHADLSALYFKSVALIFISTILLYIVIKLVSSIVVGLMINFQQTAYADVYTAAKFANLAMASQIVLFAGVIAAPIGAYILVFSDTNSFLGMGKGMADGGTALKSTASAVGAATAVGTGVGMVARGGGSLLSGAAKIGQSIGGHAKPPSTGLIIPPKQ